MGKRGRKRSHQLQSEDSPQDQDQIRLKKFSHQVAGRNPMFELSSFHILKPLNQREAQFYQKFPRNLKRFSPVYHGNATAILDDKNEIISFKSQRVLGTSRDDMSRTRLRKNLSNSDLHDDNRSESDDDSSAESRVNPWSNKLHNEDFNITKKCGKINQFLKGQSRQL